MDYIRFEQETSEIWPWFISRDEILAQETTLREIAGRLSSAGEWDTESIYESLTEAFGTNPLLAKQSEADTKEEGKNIKIKQDSLDLLWQLEEFRKKHERQAEPSDWAIRMCEAFVAHSMGFTDRVQWTELLRQRGETLFTFDWKSGSVSDHVVQWCKKNNRNWRYSHLGELQVAHGGEWTKVDYTNKIVDMFAADRTISVELLCENKLMKTIIDHYGEAVPTRTYDEEHFTANIEVDPSGTFYGWVFKFMGGIQIIAPQECVEEMKRIAHRFL